LRVFDVKNERVQEVLADAPKIGDALCDECRAHFEAVQAQLANYAVEFTITPTLVRGLDYYTRTAFEFVDEAIGAKSSICGGGRYDGLIEQLGGQRTPAIGFGAGIERLLLSLEAAGVEATPDGLDVFVALHDGNDKPRVLPLVQELRRHGLRADVDYAGRSLKGQLTHAGRLGAQAIVEWGPERSTLRRRGQQDEEVPTAELAERLQR
jgi:histidyl-tRNA synthetase